MALNEPFSQQPNVHLSTRFLDEAKQVCASQGATLDEFVDTAVAEKLAHLAHTAWVKSRLPPDQSKILALRKMLRERPSAPPDPGDELPEGYV